MHGRGQAAVHGQEKVGCQVNWTSISGHNWTLTPDQFRHKVPTMKAMDKITVVGGGLAGLTAAITCAEQGAPVMLLEAHNELGGRARSTTGPYKANLGPHAILSSSPLWKWLGERELLPRYARPRLSGVRFRWHDDIRRVPAVGATVAAIRLRNRPAPVDVDFRTWVTEQVGAEASEILARSMENPDLLPRPGRALGGLHLGAARPRPAVGAPVGPLSDRRLELTGRRHAAPGPGAWRGDPDR